MRDGQNLTVRPTLARAADIRPGAGDTERRIEALKAVLRILTRETFPLEWAALQNRLGRSYALRSRGDEAENLEAAIGAYERALTVLTPGAASRDWAETQHSLGLAYVRRVRGDTAENLETAIAAIERALTVFTRETWSRQWASAQSSLDIAYSKRIRGDKADNLDKAIAAREQALTVYTPKASPQEWAYRQWRLGNAYENRIHGDKADNLEKAIAAYEKALTIHTREASSWQWARKQRHLGDAYSKRIHSNKADNLEKAIAAFEGALTVFARETSFLDWAFTQHSLGIAYSRRIHGDKADNLEKAIAAFEAIAAYEAALTVRTPEALPREHLSTVRRLGEALLSTREWHKAAKAFASAREAFLLLFGQRLNDAEARFLIESAGPLFANAAFAAAQRGDAEGALRLADEGRARPLRVALRLGAVDLPATKRPRYAALAAEIREWERLADSAKGTDAIKAWEELAGRRKQLGELIAPHLPKATPLETAPIPEGGAVVAPIVTEFGSKLLLVTADEDSPHVAAIDLPDLDGERLKTFMRGDGSKVGAIGGWLGAYRLQYLKGKELGQRFHEWTGAIDKVGPDLWGFFGEVLDRALKAHGVKSGARLVLLPAGSLGILPLGLVQDPGSGRRLVDTYEIVYAPSLEALAAVSRQVANPPDPSLAATVNPTGDLPFTEVEGKLIAPHFARMSRSPIRLDRSTAEPELVLAAITGRSYWHFASHGTFDWGSARASGLLMRHNESLTVGRLLDTEGRLDRPRLVVLSACETGLYDINRNPEEFVGLPATFLQIGAAGVVSSLWPVDDLATALLIAKFYDLHMQDRLPPPTALKGAQIWLRDASGAELIAYAKDAAARAKLGPSRRAALETDLAARRRVVRLRISPPRAPGSPASPATVPAPGSQDAVGEDPMQSRPVKHPYYWGGFVYTGL